MHIIFGILKKKSNNKSSKQITKSLRGPCLEFSLIFFQTFRYLLLTYICVKYKLLPRKSDNNRYNRKKPGLLLYAGRFNIKSERPKDVPDRDREQHADIQRAKQVSRATVSAIPRSQGVESRIEGKIPVVSTCLM